MAMCTWCEQDMLEANSCSVAALHLNGVAVPLVRYGREPRHRSRRPVRCGDCRVTVGGHHHPGCDVAECPSCGKQLLSCDCPYDEHCERPAGKATAADAGVVTDG
jgi:hypothetical protein